MKKLWNKYKWTLYIFICKIFCKKELMDMKFLRLSNKGFSKGYSAGTLSTINQCYYIELGNYYAINANSWFAKTFLNSERIIWEEKERWGKPFVGFIKAK